MIKKQVGELRETGNIVRENKAALMVLKRCNGAEMTEKGRRMVGNTHFNPIQKKSHTVPILPDIV